MTLLSVDAITVELSGRTVLRDVSLSVSAGEIVTVIGPNGAGKSTLLRTLLGILTPSHGAVVRAKDLCVGYVPQRLSLDPTMPMSVARFLDLPRRTSRARRSAVLERVGIEGFASRSLTDLSGGEFQRVLLARALIPGPNLLVLDEPTQNLDQTGAADFYRLIESVRHETGCAIVMISHDLHVVMASSDRVICLTRGGVCCQGAPEAVASAPEYRALFGDAADGAFALYRHHDHAAS